MTDRQTVSTADYEQLKKDNERLRNIVHLTQDRFGCVFLVDADGKLVSYGSTGIREISVKIDSSIGLSLSKDDTRRVIEHFDPGNL